MSPIGQINDTTYEVELLGGDKVEIGDIESTDFKPHIKLNRWGGECWIKVQMAGDIEGEVEYELDGDKVKTKYKIKYGDFEQEVETEFYLLEPTTVIAKDKDGNDVPFIQNELGGFEFEIILIEKPATNTIVLNIETQGLSFLYQPPLTQQEIADGCIRPDNVVGSYAVYHATKRDHIIGQTNYMCGIAFHIYQPKITDAEGKWVWGELNLDEQAGTLTTTIPQGFLDTAVYPVSTGTTNFGLETKGVSSATFWGGDLRGVLASPNSDGQALSLTIWGDFYGGSSNALAIYLHSDGSLVAYTEERDIPNAEGAEETFDLTTNPDIFSANTYRLTIWGDYVRVFLNYVSDVTYLEDDIGYDYPNFPSPWTTGSMTTNYKYSIYCTYEEAGVAGIPVQSFMHMQRMRRS